MSNIDAFKLGREARNRNSNSDLNPFRYNSTNNIRWIEGWVSRELELFRESGLTREQWQRLTEKKLK